MGGIAPDNIPFRCRARLGSKSASGKPARTTSSHSWSSAFTCVAAAMGSQWVGVFGSRRSRLASSRAAALAMALQVVSTAGMEVMGGTRLADIRVV